MVIQLSKTSRKYSRQQSKKVVIEPIFHFLFPEVVIGEYSSDLRSCSQQII
jgi:hypothetical protein